MNTSTSAAGSWLLMPVSSSNDCDSVSFAYICIDEQARKSVRTARKALANMFRGKPKTEGYAAIDMFSYCRAVLVLDLPACDEHLREMLEDENIVPTDTDPLDDSLLPEDLVWRSECHAWRVWTDTVYFTALGKYSSTSVESMDLSALFDTPARNKRRKP